MEPGELRHLAHQCREQADRLNGAIDQLEGRMMQVRSEWTGNASQSLQDALEEQKRQTREAIGWLRAAATELEQGARDVQSFRDAEREREERERRERTRR
jgi:WXG100 family type VII secretion target